MQTILIQVQLLLGALSAFLPLAPAEARARAGEILGLAAKALAASVSVAANLDDLAAKLAAVRADIEARALAGQPIGDADMDAAMARVRAASAAFRAALETAEAGAR